MHWPRLYCLPLCVRNCARNTKYNETEFQSSFVHSKIDTDRCMKKDEYNKI